MCQAKSHALVRYTYPPTPPTHPPPYLPTKLQTIGSMDSISLGNPSVPPAIILQCPPHPPTTYSIHTILTHPPHTKHRLYGQPQPPQLCFPLHHPPPAPPPRCRAGLRCVYYIACCTIRALLCLACGLYVACGLWLLAVGAVVILRLVVVVAALCLPVSSISSK